MIRVAVVGTGGISASHLDAYRTFGERCTVVALCDVSPERAQARCEEFDLPQARTYSSYENLLAHEEVDLVSICTPPATHEEISVAFLTAGVNVLCEKPMAPSLAACDAILRARSGRGGVLLGGAEPLPRRRGADEDGSRLRAPRDPSRTCRSTPPGGGGWATTTSGGAGPGSRRAAAAP